MSHRDLQKIQEVTPGCLTGSLSVSSVQHVLCSVVYNSSRKGNSPGQERVSCPPILSSWPERTSPGRYKGRISSYNVRTQLIMEIDMLLQSKFTTKYNENQICLIDYLKNQMKPGSNFFKSKYIAKDTGLSSKEVGTNMALLSEICPEFKIERYSYSNSTTWLVTTPQV